MKNYRLKAMRSIAGIIAIVAIIGFSFVACDNGGGGGGDPTPTPTPTPETPSYEVSGNNFKFTDYQVYGDTMAALTGSTFAGAYPKYGDIGSSGKTLASDFTSPTCTIANGGKLTINLGVPQAAALDGLDSLSMESIASDATAQIMAVLNFRNSSEDVYLFLSKDNAGSGKTVIFVYADKAVTLNGAGFGGTYNNVSLTAGWNMVLADGFSPTTFTKITTLDSTHKWVATDDL